MAEPKIPISALALVLQPVICVRNDSISYMNPAAVELAGKDLTDRPATALFPTYILERKNSGFVASAFIGKRYCAVNLFASASERIFVLNLKKISNGTDAALFANMRSSLAELRLGGTRLSQLAELRRDIELRDCASSVNRSFYRLKREIDNLNIISLTERDEYPFFAEPTDLTQHLSDLIDTVRILLKSEVKIVFNAPEHFHLAVDRYLVELAVLNLISNSLAHCKSGNRISISLLRTDKNTVIAVNDDGSGIASDRLPYLFEREYRDTELSAAAEGIGLGLSTVRCVAQMHEGALIVESRGVGCGTSVRLMLSNFIAPTSTLHSRAPIYDAAGLACILQELCALLPDSCYTAMTDD